VNDNPQLNLENTRIERAMSLEWQAAAAALNRLALTPGGIPLEEWHWLLTSLAYADDCEADDQTTWPFAVTADADGGGGTFKYRCPKCRRVWTCFYSTDIVGMFS
jgi:hypothetical protein